MGHLALLAGVMPRNLWANPHFTEDPFALGVASGDPAPDGFVLWTRLTPRPLEEHGGMPAAAVAVRWEVAEDPRFARVVQVGTEYARPELAHSVHVEVAGLKPQRPYWYRFIVEGADPSPTGVVRTAPALGARADRLRIAVAGCQHYEAGYYTAYRHLSREADLDAVFHYGDYIYEGHAGKGIVLNGERIMVRPHVGDEIHSLDDYRRRYAQYKSDPDLQAAHAAAAFIVSFDDHEVDNNWASDFDQDGTPAEVFALRRHLAMQAWYEHMPVRRAQFPRQGGLTMYRRLDYGNTLRMHVLDTRSYRNDQLCATPGQLHCRAVDSADASMLGPAQEAWLAQGLGGGATWNLIAQQVMVMPFDRRKPGAATPALSDDGWDGYPAARGRLFDAIRQQGLTNVVIATGDVHQHYVSKVPPSAEDMEGASIASEFVCTSISSNGDGSPVRAGQEHHLSNNPHVLFNNAQRGYQLFNVTPDEWSADLKVVDQVEKPGGQLSTLASFHVTPDRAEPQRG